MPVEFAVHFKDGAGNGSVHKCRVFKTERGARNFVAELRQPWNFRFYDISEPMVRKV